LVLSEFLPVLVEIILMVGGTYLCFEGAEKIPPSLLAPRSDSRPSGRGARFGPRGEDDRRRDPHRLHPSGEIMVISLKEVIDESFVSRTVILLVVAVLITVIVYGLVALIVKRMTSACDGRVGQPAGSADRAGDGHGDAEAAGGALHRRHRGDGVGRRSHPDRRCARARLARPVRPRPNSEDPFHDVAAIGGVLTWLVNTAASAIVGLIVGFAVVAWSPGSLAASTTRLPADVRSPLRARTGHDRDLPRQSSTVDPARVMATRRPAATCDPTER
jgi:hypothetical protein